jgi:pimeloyl-ACP methyl ester carboxylesterase
MQSGNKGMSWSSGGAGRSQRRPPGWKQWSTLGLGVGSVLTGLAVANHWLTARGGLPQRALGGDADRYIWEEGEIAYEVKGRGQPLVLAHGIYPGAASFEWRHNFGTLAEHFRVYAFDLLGFGLSARPAITYTAALYARLITDFVREVAGGADHAVHLAATSLSAAYAIQAASLREDLFGSLVLIEPAGLGIADIEPGPGERFLRDALDTPLFGQSICNLATSRFALREFLRTQVYGPSYRLSKDMVDYYYLSSHQPGGRHALASILAGSLHMDVEAPFSKLSLPMLLIWGRQAVMNPPDEAAIFLQLNKHARLEVFDQSRLLPQDEEPDAFNELVRRWMWAQVQA